MSPLPTSPGRRRFSIAPDVLVDVYPRGGPEHANDMPIYSGNLGGVGTFLFDGQYPAEYWPEDESEDGPVPAHLFLGDRGITLVDHRDLEHPMHPGTDEPQVDPGSPANPGHYEDEDEQVRKIHEVEGPSLPPLEEIEHQGRTPRTIGDLLQQGRAPRQRPVRWPGVEDEAQQDALEPEL